MDFTDFFDTLLIERTSYNNDNNNDVDNNEDDKYNY